MKFWMSMIVVALLAGCQPKLDGSSNEAMTASTAKIKESLTPEEVKKFEESLKIIALSELNLKSILSGEKSEVDFAGKMKKTLDGKGYSDVVAMADKIKEDRKLREKEQAIEEIKELAEKIAKAKSDKESLAKIVVNRSRFYKRPQTYGRPEPIIELSLTNGTDKAISRVYARGTIASPGRTIPWLSEEFNYSISGGIEPGEKNEISLSPNKFSDWGRVDAPSDAVFTVEIYKVDGPDEKTLFSSDPEDLEKWETRISALQAEYGL